MRTCVDTLIALAHVDGPRVRKEAKFIADQLDILRSTGQISNDAYLDAGAIQGGMMMIANLIDAGIDRNELSQHMAALVSRSNHVEEAHPGLSAAVESIIS